MLGEPAGHGGGRRWAGSTHLPAAPGARRPAGWGRSRSGPAPPGAAPRARLYLHRACPCVNAARRGLSQGPSGSRSLSAAPGEGWPFPRSSVLIYVRTAARRGRPRTAGPATRRGEAAGPGTATRRRGCRWGRVPCSPHRLRTAWSPAGSGPRGPVLSSPARHGALPSPGSGSLRPQPRRLSRCPAGAP